MRLTKDVGRRMMEERSGLSCHCESAAFIIGRIVSLVKEEDSLDAPKAM